MINEIICGRRNALGEEIFLESAATKIQTDESKKKKDEEKKKSQLLVEKQKRYEIKLSAGIFAKKIFCHLALLRDVVLARQGF